MNIEEMGIKVAEALALQGKVNSLVEQVEQATASINANEREISRIKSIEKTNAQTVINKKKLTDELSSLKAELEKRLVALEKDGITLPIGNKVQVTTTRL